MSCFFAFFENFFSATAFFLWTIFLWPAILLLNAIRYGIASVLCVPVRLRKFYATPGGVTDIISATSPGRVVAAILLPRALTFMLGLLLAVPLVWYSFRYQAPLLTTTFGRPDYLRLDIDMVPVTAILALDAWETHGIIIGTALIAAFGCFAVSLPTHDEMHVCWLSANAGAGRTGASGKWAIIRRALTMGGAATSVTGAIETMFFWANGPIYIALALVPIAMGFGVTAAIVALLPAAV